MSPPRMTVPLVLEAAERVADDMGGYRTRWRALGVLHAGMSAGGGAQRPGDASAKSIVPWRITVRGARAGDPRRPEAGQRFRMGARVFGIDAVAEADPAGMWLTCFAQEERFS